MLTLTVAYHLAILLLPLLLSRDVFSYAYYGRILSRYGGNPYVNTPADYPANDLWRFTWPGWRETPSVYGPVFVWLAAAITAIFRSIPDVIMAFRAVAVAASLGAVWFVVKLVQRVKPSKTAYAAAMIGLNPVVLFHTVGGGHVDVLVMLSVAAAIYLVATDRELPATVALTVGALVKISAAVPLVLLIAYVATRAEPGKRARVLVTHIGTAVGIFIRGGVAVPAALEPDARHGRAACNTVRGSRLRRWSSASSKRWASSWPERSAHRSASSSRGSGMFAALAIGLFLVLRQVVRHATEGSVSFLAAAWGWGFLLMMLFSPTLFPWYFAWVLPVAWALPLVPRRTLELSFLALVTASLTTENFQLPAWMHVDLRDRAPGARHRARVVPARPVAAVEVRRAARRRDRPCAGAAPGTTGARRLTRACARRPTRRRLRAPDRRARGRSRRAWP